MARILQVVDCFDALTSDRPYRRELPKREALQILADRKGTTYDPRIVDVFFSLHGEEGERAMASEVTPPEPRESSPRTIDPAAPVTTTGLPLRSFYDLGRALPSSPSPRQLGEALWEHLATHLPASAFVLYTYDVQTHALVVGFCSAEGLVAPDVRVPIGEGLTGWVAATGRSVVNSDARLELPDGVSASLGLTSTLAVPARVGEQVSAVLTFYAREVDAFTPAHCQVAEAAAEVVASAHLRATPSAVAKAA